VDKGITRRAILALVPGLPAAAGADLKKKTRPLPAVGEFVRFPDPTTETPVVRLTSPASASILPAPTNRFVSVRERFLVFSSDRHGKLQPYRADLRTGLITAITTASELDPRSLCMDRKERYLHFLDRGRLRTVNLHSGREERLAAESVGAFSMVEDVRSGAAEFWIVRNNRLEYLAGDDARLVAENVSDACLSRPHHSGCLFTRNLNTTDEREIWYAETDAAGTKPVLLASGRVSNPVWSADGGSIFMLRDVLKRGTYFSEIHELIPESKAEQCVAPTSQFAAFSPNGDDSVFVGASRSKAQPNIILLLRSVQREFTLCEHRASHPTAVVPVFSPDSRRVYFQSDHQGKPAIYSVNVELLVEPTPAAVAA
jgi:Tol biopolymer transport system component